MNIMMGVYGRGGGGVSEYVMIGCLAHASHLNAQIIFLPSNEVTGIVHANLGVIPVGIHLVLSRNNEYSIWLFPLADVVFPVITLSSICIQRLRR